MDHPPEHKLVAAASAGEGLRIQAPGHEGVSREPPPRRAPSRHEAERGAWPGIDQRLVVPETREECVQGQKILTMPALDPHADRHCELDYVIRGSVAEDYICATDLLTRVGPKSDFATDTCVRRAGIDPKTDTRYLEELVFEVVFEQSLAHITERAGELSKRGVRRVIAILVKSNEVREWAPRAKKWKHLNPEGTLRDRTLAIPIPIRALLSAGEADNSVVQALHVKKNPALMTLERAALGRGLKTGRDEGRKAGRKAGHKVGRKAGHKAGLVEGLKTGREEGREEATREAIEVLCEVLAIPLGPQRRAHLQALDGVGLRALLHELRHTKAWP